MRTILDYINIKPTDEKILTENPKFNKVSDDMELKRPQQQDFEMTEFSLFQDEAKLKDAVSTLWENGFSTTQISTFTSHDGNLLDHFGELKESKLGEGLLLGITIGIVAGGIFGWASGYEFFTPFRSLPIPRFFNLLLFSVIWGFIGGVLGALIGRSIPEYQEKEYETRLAEGTMLVLVKTTDHGRARIARRILTDHGGRCITPDQIRKAG
jgi:hypothetical protein